ncbi:MAG: glutaredoxin family protein [Opitutaceae bacterium]
MKPRPILFIKDGCPWCREALSFFSEQGIEVDVQDVNESASAYQRMISVSDQTNTPTFEFGDFVVADFDVEEFVDELDQRPDVKEALGLTMVDEDDY